MSSNGSSASRPGSGSKPSGMWQPPSLEEMRAMLPQYQFSSLLGRGGMGAVYKAVQVSLDRPVAIKVLPGDLIVDTDSQFAERFKNEARTMAKMNHPSIVNVYDFGETQTGLLFIVMEFIDGTDVSKMIAAQGKLPEDYALSITAHVCDALNYAHRSGVIHRDIKPANILINMEGAVKVADFGLAKQSEAGMSGLTKTNMAMGTPDFVAPEALIPGMPLDGRADLYAIGVMLYQMLTGEIPRGMWTMPGMKFGTDPRFDAIIGKAMQTDREVRYQSAAEIRTDLDTILTTPRAMTRPQPVSTPAQKPVAQGQQPAGQPETMPSAKKRSGMGLLMGLGAAVVIAAGAYLFFKPSAAVKGGGTAATATKGEAPPAKPQPQSASGSTSSKGKALPSIPGWQDAMKLVFDAARAEGLGKNAGAWLEASKRIVGLPLSGTNLTDYAVKGRTRGSVQINLANYDGPAGFYALGIERNRVEMLLARPGGGNQRYAMKTLPEADEHDFFITLEAGVLNAWVDREWVGEARNLGVKPGRPQVSMPGAGSAAHGLLVADLNPDKNTVAVAMAPPPERAVRQTLDLLALIDPVKDRVSAPNFTGKNEWRREGSELVFQPDGKSGKLAPPVAFACTDYEIEFKAKKHSGNDRIHVDLPLNGGRILPLVFNGRGRKPVNEREGTPWGNADGDLHLSIRVVDAPGNTGRIVIRRLDAGGGTLADWSGDLGQHAKPGEAHPDFPGQPLPSVFVMKDKYAVQTFRLRVFEGEAKVLRESTTTAPVAANAAPPPPTAQMTVPSPAPAIMPASEPVTQATPTATDPVSVKLADLDAKFQAAFERDAGGAYKTQVAALNTGYVAALDRELAAAAKAGKLEDALVLREEKQRITDGKSLPPEDLDSLPDSLKKLRGTWRVTESGYAKQRETKAGPLYDTYDRMLDTYQKELTQQNKIDDALRVKEVRDGLANRRETAVSSTDTTPPSAKAAASASASPTVPAAEPGSSWRKAAEWVLAVGGEVSVKGVQGNIKNAKDLPSGRFSMQRIILNLQPKAGAAITDDDLTRLNGLRDLEVLHLNHLPNVTGSGLAALASSADSLSEIECYDVGLLPSSVDHLLLCKNLKTLDLNGTKSLTSEALARLGVLKDLRILSLRMNPGLDSKALLAFAECDKITTLDLTSTAVTDEGLLAVRQMTGMDRLELTGARGIQGPGLANLAGFTLLKRLHLGGTSVTDASLQALEKLTKLEVLDLRETKITGACLPHLAGLTKLQTLNLSAADFTGEGFDALSGCAELSDLCCGGGGGNPPCNITDEGLRDLAKAALPMLRKLSIKGKTITDAGIAYLASLKLTDLYLEAQPGVEGARAIASMQTLQRLSFGGGPAGDAEVAELTRLKSLQTLNFYDCQVTDAALPGILAMPNLKSFLFYKSKITPAAIEAAKKTRPDLKIGR